MNIEKYFAQYLRVRCVWIISAHKLCCTSEKGGCFSLINLYFSVWIAMYRKQVATKWVQWVFHLIGINLWNSTDARSGPNIFTVLIKMKYFFDTICYLCSLCFSTFKPPICIKFFSTLSFHDLFIFHFIFGSKLTFIRNTLRLRSSIKYRDPSEFFVRPRESINYWESSDFIQIFMASSCAISTFASFPSHFHSESWVSSSSLHR